MCYSLHGRKELQSEGGGRINDCVQKGFNELRLQTITDNEWTLIRLGATWYWLLCNSSKTFRAKVQQHRFCWFSIFSPGIWASLCSSWSISSSQMHQWQLASVCETCLNTITRANNHAQLCRSLKSSLSVIKTTLCSTSQWKCRATKKQPSSCYCYWKALLALTKCNKLHRCHAELISRMLTYQDAPTSNMCDNTMLCVKNSHVNVLNVTPDVVGNTTTVFQPLNT